MLMEAYGILTADSTSKQMQVNSYLGDMMIPCSPVSEEQKNDSVI
jgi:hypothetical protein